MLAIIVRSTALGVALFIALLAGLFVIAEEEAFPAGAGYAVSLDFSDSTLTKGQAIAALGALSDRTGLVLTKVVADPDDFYSGRSLYVFGSAAPARPREWDWFTPGRHGELRSALDLGTASLDGQYALVGTPADRLALEHELDDAGVHHAISPRTDGAVLGYALFNTGAWLPFATCLLLVLSLGTTWYVLRMRARTLKVLAGSRTRAILAEDLVSLLRVTVPSFLAGGLLAVGVLAVRGDAAHIPRYAAVLAVGLGGAVVALSAGAILVGVLTWPSVQTIAVRVPPERHFRLLSEAIKVVCVILLGATAPVAAGSIASASEASAHGAQWALLGHELTVRISTDHREFEGRVDDMAALAAAADDDRALMFSYAIDLTGGQEPAGTGYDAVVLANPRYLDAVGAGALRRASVADLPPPLADYLRASFPLWARDSASGIDERLALYTTEGGAVAGLLPIRGEMRDFAHPLVVVVDRPSEVFDDDFLASTLSTGNLLFDSGWLSAHVAKAPVADLVLSLDRAADAGLAEAQSEAQTALTQGFSLALEVLALVMAVAVGAWIHAIGNARRLFVSRTAGVAWPTVLRRRLVVEGTLAVVLGAIIAAIGGVWWLAVFVAPAYFALSCALHVNAARAIFGKVLSRTA